MIEQYADKLNCSVESLANHIEDIANLLCDSCYSEILLETILDAVVSIKHEVKPKKCEHEWLIMMPAVHGHDSYAKSYYSCRKCGKEEKCI